MSELREKKMRQIRGLLDKAESPAVTEEERESLVAKAMELMTRYQIERGDLGEGSAVNAGSVERRKFWVTRNPYMVGKEQLIIKTAKAFGMMSVLLKGQYQRDEDGNMALDAKGEWIPGEYVEVMGFPEDLEMLDVMYTSLLMQVTRGIDRDRDKMLAACPHPGNQIPWKNNWTCGFADEVSRRLAEARREVAQDVGASGAMVLVRSEDAIADAFKEAYPRLRSSRRRMARDYAAYGAGTRAGKSADLNRTRVGGSRGALAS